MCPVEDELTEFISELRCGVFAERYHTSHDCGEAMADRIEFLVSRLRAATPHPPEPRLFPNMTGPAVPWWLLAPCEARARQNHGGQTLERLAERGGLSACEIVALLENRSWRGMDQPAANARIVEVLERAATPHPEPEPQSQIEMLVRADVVGMKQIVPDANERDKFAGISRFYAEHLLDVIDKLRLAAVSPSDCETEKP